MNKFLFVFSVFAFAQIFASGPHDGERAAWGGNGGWWGNSQNDWYGEYGTLEERRDRGNDNDVDGGALYFNFR